MFPMDIYTIDIYGYIMGKWRFEYTVESMVANTVTIEADDEYEALDKFDAMKEDLIAENYEDLKKIGNIRVGEDPYWEEIK